MLGHPYAQVHFNTPMNPLELEMYHQIKNVIGVNPSFYEYLFTVDADTTADENSLNFLISAYVFVLIAVKAARLSTLMIDPLHAAVE